MRSGALVLAACLVSSWSPSHGLAKDSAPEPVAAGTTSSEVDKAREKEYLVKAAFLLNFIKYTKWPKGSFEKQDSPILLVVLGEDPFGETLDKTFKDKLVDGRAIQLSRLSQVPKELEAHLVFVAAGLEKKQREKLFELVGDEPILLAGEETDFAIDGGHCNFVLVDGRVKFEINPTRAKASELSISSELLKLARIVPEGEELER
ncbi:MAG: YfiR family protein [Planctomycetota bacterium]|nr:YfiR family protein [Planctomycetota bacterium]